MSDILTIPAFIIMSLILAVMLIYWLYQTIKKDRYWDASDEKSRKELNEYFRNRDAGAPPDPLLKIKFREDIPFTGRVWIREFNAEELYQDELKRKEKEKQHQDYVDWISAHTSEKEKLKE